MTAVCFALTMYFTPTSYRVFKDLQHTLRNTYPTVLLQEGVFSNVMGGVTVYVRSRTDDGELFGLIVHDARDLNNPVTMMAERGAILAGANGPRIVLVNGNRQEVDKGDGRLSLLYFDRYSFDLSAVSKDEGDRWREPRERFLNELFFPKSQENSIGYFHKFRMEGHHRLSAPLLPLTFTLIGLACLLGGQFNRRGLLWRIIAAIVFTIAIEVGHLGIKSLGERAPEIAFLMYLAPILPGAVAVWLLNPRTGVRLSRSRQAAASPG
jgi:lipopolysaccharide export system permease protein